MKTEAHDIDIKENFIYSLDKAILTLLLKDRSSDRNIIWATDTYAWRGVGYEPQDNITVASITGKRGNVIKPRTQKSQKEQHRRIKNKAEVFTPSWVCNEMCNHFDEAWFGRANVFNTPSDKTWTKTKGKIDFPAGKNWQDYVALKVLEISCGEAPFLASRYDTVSGQWLDVNERIGLLDRKLRVVNENTDGEQEWVEWAILAYKSTYAYEWQGDSLLIARENLLFTFIDYYTQRFKHYPINEYLTQISKILSWNVWQMDGLKGVIPYSCKPLPKMQMSLFDFDEPPRDCPGCASNNNNLHTGIYCKIKNYKSNKNIPFIKVQGDNKMKFDFVIGNPPYQDVTIGDNKTFAPQIYNLFLDSAYEIAQKVEMIHPARFLFNAGSTPKQWNKKMLNDEHFKVIKYFAKSAEVFPNTDIKGGVAITYRDETRIFSDSTGGGIISVFTPHSELNNIGEKVTHSNSFNSISDIIESAYAYHLTKKLYDDFPNLIGRLSKGHEYDLKSNIFELMPEIFFDNQISDEYIRILGRLNSKRIYKWVKRDYITDTINFNKYKVFVAGANGSGAIGETLSTPLIGSPLIGSTESFLSIGAFLTESEAQNCCKYIKTKFARALLGILKVTQAITPDKWRYVPMQDFTSSSDIDWSQSVAEIDEQLFKKYGLDQREISFIKSHIKEMN